MRLAPHVQVGGLTENPTMPLYTARRIEPMRWPRWSGSNSTIASLMPDTRHGASNTRGSHRN